VKVGELPKVSLDDLWDLHKRVESILEKRLDHDKQKLEQQLEELNRKFGGPPSDFSQRRWYPKVPQNTETQCSGCFGKSSFA